eukprot:COSAG02_NODE_8953_length_2384_cov_1.177243_4_plen_52_part_00
MPVGGEVRIRMEDGHTRISALPHRPGVAHILSEKYSAPLCAVEQSAGGAST